MSIIEHGDWTRYDPSPRPKDAPLNAMFARRSGDTKDWYLYVNPPATSFQTGSAKMTVYRQAPNGPTVGAAVLDATMLWPAQALIVEDTGYSGSNPQADYGGKIYDPATKTFSNPPLPEPPAALDTEARIAALEAKVNAK